MADEKKNYSQEQLLGFISFGLKDGFKGITEELKKLREAIEKKQEFNGF